MAISALLISALIACTPQTAENLPKIRAAIIPHHLFVEVFMEDIYQKIATDPQNQYGQIIIISPNHFGYGHKYIQTATEVDPREHGITAHYDLVQKNFQNTKILPITIKQGTPQPHLDELIQELQQQNLPSTLIIASIDFSHQTPELSSLKNDERTINWLQKDHSTQTSTEIYEQTQSLAKSSNQDYDGVAMDSPETLYVLTRLMLAQNTASFTFWKRTSSADLTKIQNPLQNTSHIFGWYK